MPRSRSACASAAPVPDAREGVGLATGVEHHQRDRHLGEVQLVDEPVAGLARRVPEQHLAGFRAAAFERDGVAGKRVHLAAVGGSRVDVLVPREHPRQAGLPDAGVADQHDLRVAVLHVVRGHAAEQRLGVHPPDPHGPIPIAQSREVGQTGMERQRRGVAPRGLLSEARDRLLGISPEDPDLVGLAFDGEQPAVGGVRHRRNPPEQALDGRDLAPAVGVPEAHRAVPAADASRELSAQLRVKAVLWCPSRCMTGAPLLFQT